MRLGVVSERALAGAGQSAEGVWVGASRQRL